MKTNLCKNDRIMANGSWSQVNLTDLAISGGISFTVGMLKVLQLIRSGRQVRWVDAVYEPCLAVFGGMLMWAFFELADAPGVLKAIATSLGAYGGTRTIAYLERRYMPDIPAEVKQ